MTEQTQTAYSTSVFTDPTNIAAALQCGVGILALQEVRDVIPLSAMPAILAISGALSFILRTFSAVRPVAFIAPTEVKPVEVKKLEKTQQGSETLKTGPNDTRGAGFHETDAWHRPEEPKP